MIKMGRAKECYVTTTRRKIFTRWKISSSARASDFKRQPAFEFVLTIALRHVAISLQAPVSHLIGDSH